MAEVKKRRSVSRPVVSACVTAGKRRFLGRVAAGRGAGSARSICLARRRDPYVAQSICRREGENGQREGAEARTAVNGWKEFKLCEVEQELLKQLRITFKMWDLFYLE